MGDCVLLYRMWEIGIRLLNRKYRIVMKEWFYLRMSKLYVDWLIGIFNIVYSGDEEEIICEKNVSKVVNWLIIFLFCVYVVWFIDFCRFEVFDCGVNRR